MNGTGTRNSGVIKKEDSRDPPLSEVAGTPPRPPSAVKPPSIIKNRSSKSSMSSTGEKGPQTRAFRGGDAGTLNPPRESSRSSRRLDFGAVNAAALRELPALVVRWLPDGGVRGREYTARNPRRADRSPGSFRVNLRTGRWSDFATGDAGGDPISLAAYLFGLSQIEAARRLAEMLGVPR